MPNNVRHGKRLFKQMALEVAVRNPERYEGILKTFAKFEGVVLDDEGVLEVYSQLYLDEVLTADALSDDVLTKEFVSDWIFNNCSHKNEWGFPTGYQGAFCRYLKTLSEFGFIYAQYKQELRLSPVAKALVNGKITLSEAFALQSMRFWRKSPYRRVLNNFNFFEFIIDSMIALKEKGHYLSYNQFLVGLFSDDGNIVDYLRLLKNYKVGDKKDKAYALVKKKYDKVDTEHQKVSKQNTAFRDYGNAVFRVLRLTGFITVEYAGILMLTPNESRMSLYKALKAKKFFVSESAKENEEEYFEQLGSFDTSLESLILSHREQVEYSTAEYNKKIPKIIKSYGLTSDLIEQALKKLSKGETRGRNLFWFIQDPVKLEFLLTLFVYSRYGDTFEYKPNFICDESGIPYSHAPGNIGDIEIFNKDIYWLIEATLIRSKNQQINNETVNLFRHINDKMNGQKYLTLVAPFIHEDTKLIFSVASIITMIKNNMLSLISDAQTINEFIEDMKGNEYFDMIDSRTQDFMSSIRSKLNEIHHIGKGEKKVLRYEYRDEEDCSFSRVAES